MPGTNTTVTFTYSIQDGFGGTAMATGTVTIAPSPAPVVSQLVREGNNFRVSWTGTGGYTNQVQVAIGSTNGAYTNGFSDLGTPMTLPGTGAFATNYLDSGAYTNALGRFYRVRVIP